jgi:hypothetical protein
MDAPVGAMHEDQLLGTGLTPYENYVPGEKDSYGRIIKTVLGRHRLFCVYITQEDAVGWHYTQLPEHLRPAIANFQFLNGIASSTLKKKQRPQVALLLGTALYAALLSQPDEDAVRHFESARNFIYSKGTQLSRLAYVLLSLLFAIIITGLAFVVYKYSPASEGFRVGLLVGISGGVIGAVISIIQRSRNLRIDPLDSAIVLALHGLTRVALGAIFGMLLVVASKADIALCHFSENPWGLFGLSAAAGFTERWIPELLEHIK